MIIKKGHIEIKKTGFYYISGDITNKTKEVWIVLHGYGQLGGEFLLNFREIADESRIIISPEGLSKFYLKSGQGKTGASWMTKDDREFEINNYVNYLDELYLKEIEPYLKTNNLKITGFGFSQGCSTLTRWIVLGKHNFDRVICWCGSVAEDIDYSKRKNLQKTNFHLVFGKKDTLYSPSFPVEQSHILLKNGIESTIHYFDGGHEIKPNDIRKLILV